MTMNCFNDQHYACERTTDEGKLVKLLLTGLSLRAKIHNMSGDFVKWNFSFNRT
jgi:hypothetical protein